MEKEAWWNALSDFEKDQIDLSILEGMGILSSPLIPKVIEHLENYSVGCTEGNESILWKAYWTEISTKRSKEVNIADNDVAEKKKAESFEQPITAECSKRCHEDSDTGSVYIDTDDESAEQSEDLLRDEEELQIDFLPTQDKVVHDFDSKTPDGYSKVSILMPDTESGPVVTRDAVQLQVLRTQQDDTAASSTKEELEPPWNNDITQKCGLWDKKSIATPVMVAFEKPSVEVMDSPPLKRRRLSLHKETAVFFAADDGTGNSVSVARASYQSKKQEDFLPTTYEESMFANSG